MLSLQPIITCPTLVRKDYTIFSLPIEEFEVTIPRTLSNKLISLCDGLRTVESIVSDLEKSWSRRSLIGMFRTLFRRGILVDSRSLSSMIIPFINNPTLWVHNNSESQIADMVLDNSIQLPKKINHTFSVTHNTNTRQLLKRRSVRVFDSVCIDEKALVRIMWASYGMLPTKINIADTNFSRRTVPSAGALYPLSVFLALFKKCGSIQPGVYRVTSNTPEKVELESIRKESAQTPLCFVNSSATDGAIGVFFVCGSITRSEAKYGNRGFLYTILEAGHVAQNLLSQIEAENLASLEVGGFYEEKLRHFLKLSRTSQPMTSVIFGKEQRVGKLSLSSFHVPIVRRIEIAKPDTVDGYTLPFKMVFAESFPDGKDESWWSCGRSTTITVAKKKAVSEAVEWFACTRFGYYPFLEDSYKNLGKRAIDPRTMAAYADHQYSALTGLRPFDLTATYQWREAVNRDSGQERFVLADFVHFPFTAKVGERYYFANSSGVAAHFSERAAFENALLELVEREAFMVSWINRLNRTQVQLSSLPQEFDTRVKALRKVNVALSVSELTLDLAPVILVSAHHKEKNFFTCAAASEFDILGALDRALMEVEASVYCWIRDGFPERPISVKSVKFPDDHERVFQNTKNITNAMFLMEGKALSFRKIEAQQTVTSMSILKDRLKKAGLECYIVRLSEEDPLLQPRPLKVVRAIVPGMVSMTFGYRTEPMLLPRLRSLPVTCKLLSEPIKLREMNTFPHPYT